MTAAQTMGVGIHDSAHRDLGPSLLRGDVELPDVATALEEREGRRAHEIQRPSL